MRKNLMQAAFRAVVVADDLKFTENKNGRE